MLLLLLLLAFRSFFLRSHRELGPSDSSEVLLECKSSLSSGPYYSKESVFEFRIYIFFSIAVCSTGVLCLTK
jgi:hypothetical protein